MKRKKYTEDLDIKITDDEDEQEDVDVTTTAAAVASISSGAPVQLKQEVELDGDGLPSMQFFVVSVEQYHFFLLSRWDRCWLCVFWGVCFYSHLCVAICDVCSVSFWHVFILQENPSEEDAAIVDKILSMRLTKKEVRSLN